MGIAIDSSFGILLLPTCCDIGQLPYSAFWTWSDSLAITQLTVICLKHWHEFVIAWPVRGDDESVARLQWSLRSDSRLETTSHLRLNTTQQRFDDYSRPYC